MRVVCEAKLAKKIAHSQNCCNYFWPVTPSGREPHSSLLNIEKCLGGLTLRIDVLVLPIAQDLALQAGSGREVSKLGSLLVRVLQRFLRSWARNFAMQASNPAGSLSLSNKETSVCPERHRHEVAPKARPPAIQSPEYKAMIGGETARPAGTRSLARSKSGRAVRDGADYTVFPGFLFCLDRYLLRFQCHTRDLSEEKRATTMDRFLQGDMEGFASKWNANRGHQRIRCRANEWTRPVILAAAPDKNCGASGNRAIPGPTRELPAYRTTRMVAMDHCGHHHASAHGGAGVLSSS